MNRLMHPIEPGGESGLDLGALPGVKRVKGGQREGKGYLQIYRACRAEGQRSSSPRAEARPVNLSLS